MTIKQRLLVLAGILISVGFLWFAVSGLHVDEILRAAQQANMGWLLASLPVFVLAVLVIALRWGYLLHSLHAVPLRYLFDLVNIGYMGNNVYPLRAGEFLRVLLLQRDYQIPIARTTTTIFVERIFDGVICLGFILAPLLLLDLSAPELRAGALAVLPVFAVGTLVFFVLALNPDLLRRVIGAVSRFLPGVLQRIAAKLTQDVIDGMESLRQPRYLLGTVVNSVLTWVLQGVVYWLVGLAFGIQANFLVMLLAVGAVNMSGALPATPGQIGVFEFFASSVVMLAGVERNTALAYAFVLHAIIWLPPTLLGFVLLARRGLGFGAIVHAAREHTLDEGTAPQPVSGQQTAP